MRLLNGGLGDQGAVASVATLRFDAHCMNLGEGKQEDDLLEHVAEPYFVLHVGSFLPDDESSRRPLFFRRCFDESARSKAFGLIQPAFTCDAQAARLLAVHRRSWIIQDARLLRQKARMSGLSEASAQPSRQPRCWGVTLKRLVGTGEHLPSIQSFIIISFFSFFFLSFILARLLAFAFLFVHLCFLSFCPSFLSFPAQAIVAQGFFFSMAKEGTVASEREGKNN